MRRATRRLRRDVPSTRPRMILFTCALAVAALGVGASCASATLFTTPTHTAHVPVGAVATATTTNAYRLTAADGTTLTTCAHSRLLLTVTQNNDTGLVLSVTGALFAGCSNAVTGTLTPTWVVTSVGATTNAGTTQVQHTRWDGVQIHTLGGLYSGFLTVGATMTEPTGGTPICLRLQGAGHVVGPLLGDGRIDAAYCLTGTGVLWSFT